MLVKMFSEKGGYTHVYDQASLDFHKSEGWVVCDDIKSAEVNNVTHDEPVEAIPERKKPGRKPGWNLK